MSGSISLSTTTQLKLTELQISYAMIGLVSTAVSRVTNPWVYQPVDIVGAAVLNLNEEPGVATVSKLVNANFSCDCILSHCRMISTQPGREV